MSKTPMTHEAAVGVVRDVLEERGAEADAVLAEVLPGRKVAGPIDTLEGPGHRFSLRGAVGSFGRDGLGPTWRWELHALAYGDPPPVYSKRAHGTAASRQKAIEAMDAALRAQGWTLGRPEEGIADTPEVQAVRYCTTNPGSLVLLVVADNAAAEAVRRNLYDLVAGLDVANAYRPVTFDNGSALRVLRASGDVSQLLGQRFDLAIVACALPLGVEVELRNRARWGGEIRGLNGESLTLTDRGAPIARSTDDGATWTPLEGA